MRSNLSFQKSKESEAEFCIKQKHFFHILCVSVVFVICATSSNPIRISFIICNKSLRPLLFECCIHIFTLIPFSLDYYNPNLSFVDVRHTLIGEHNRFVHNHGTIKVQVQMGDTRSKYLISFECPCPPLVKCIALFSLQSQNPLRKSIFFLFT